jgi:tRNA A37 threonylcarbamoyladenosine biosynthesis protein TsaE
VVIEWADIVEDVLPADKLTVTIKTTGETEREFKFKYLGDLQYLIPYNT